MLQAVLHGRHLYAGYALRVRFRAMAFQPEPTPEPPPSGGGGPVTINFDIGRLVEGIVNGFREGLNAWSQEILINILNTINEGIAVVWNGIWDSGANLLATPFALTIDFGPAKLLGVELFLVIYGILMLSVVLLGVRNMWRVMSGGGGALSDAVNGVLLGAMLATASTLIIAQAFMLTGLASDWVGRLDYRPALDAQNLLTIGPSLVLGLFTLVVMIVYGWKLMVRAAYRIVLLMFLTPWAPAASALWAIPQTKWIATLYWVTVGGWLAGGALAIGAISLGVQLALNNTNGVLALIFGVALVQIAHDLMAILPKGALGGISVGSPFGAAFSAVLGGAAGGAIGGAVGGSAGGFGGASGGGGVVAGALPSGDEPGFGY